MKYYNGARDTLNMKLKLTTIQNPLRQAKLSPKMT